jgi:DNA-binding HxlR family transcriptional regulator
MADECVGIIDTALDVYTGKWKLIILFHMFQRETLRFSELQRLIPDITKKMLTSQLRELEYHDIINRVVYPQVPPRVEYSITEYGRGLMPVLRSMHNWGLAHIEHLNELFGEERKVQS